MGPGMTVSAASLTGAGIAHRISLCVSDVSTVSDLLNLCSGVLCTSGAGRWGGLDNFIDLHRSSAHTAHPQPTIGRKIVLRQWFSYACTRDWRCWA